ncbi:MAG TPA: TIR domain-containing protein [Devosia sp.]|nr:TIR domain-containing protein [Devosia sp.]
MAASERYAAFISYRHLPRDRHWALRLMARLETFRVPKELQARGYPKSLGTLFRDEDELPTSSDLNEQIEDALSRSDALIVICTPDTPKSKWVRREIEYFKSIGKAERIFTVLVDGEPDEAYAPELLTRIDDDGTEIEVEPLGTDVRPSPHYSARALERRAVLKLAAGILGVGFDELAQRDRARRQRQTRMVLAGVAGVVVAAAAGGWWYWDSRLAIKTEFCAAIAESRGLPQCVGTIDGATAAQRSETWRIKRQAGMARELALVNGHGQPIDSYFLDAPPLQDWRYGMAYQTYNAFDTDRAYVEQFDAAGNEQRTLIYSFAPDRKAAVLSFSYGLGVGLRQQSDEVDGSLPFDLSIHKVSQIGQHRLQFDDAGRITRRDYQPLGSVAAARDEHGALGKAYRYDGRGLVTSVINIDGEGKPLNTRNGLAELRYEYNDAGDVVRLGWFNASGNPWPRGDDGFVSFDYRRDAVGNVPQLIGGNVQGETMVWDRNAGWPGYMRKVNEHGDFIGAEYLDADGTPFMPGWDASIARYVEELDGQFRLVRRVFEGPDGSPVMGHLGYAELRRVLDGNGRVQEISYYDAAGKLQSMSRYKWDERGRVTERTDFGPDGNPLALTNWTSGGIFPVTRYGYDTAGNLVERAYFDAAGQPAENALRISRFVWSYDDRGNPLSEVHYDVEGREAGSPQGDISRITASYDDRGNMTEVRFLTPEGKLLHTDWYGNPLRRRTFDDRSMMTIYEEFESEGVYASYNAVTRYSYDDVGRVLSEGTFDGAGNAVNNDCYEYVSRIERRYDPDGNLALEEFYDADGKPAPGDYDVFRHTMTYDTRGNMIADEVYDVAGNPIPGMDDSPYSYLPNYCDY